MLILIVIIGMRDADLTKMSGHPHALNEVVPSDKEKDVIAAAKKKLKCSKCWKKIDPLDSYFRCEQCKTFMECTECYQSSDKSGIYLVYQHWSLIIVLIHFISPEIDRTSHNQVL